tara:strand:+ start:57 stop:773 length:717 start_codon:yes stop_codon:yes gene_type:complete
MATYSEDGQWMWNGSEWIPSPPSSHTSNIPAPSHVQLQDSVVGGDVNITPQVHHHHNQQIVQNQIKNQTIHPMEDFTQAVTDAYESGKSALISLGIIFAVLCVGASIGFLFDPGFSSYCNSNTVNQSGYPECEGWTDTYDEENFTQSDYFSGFIVISIILWLAGGIFIFIKGGPINTFSRLREEFPSSPTLERGDKGKNFHDIAKYLWLAPFVIIIIAIIVGLIVMKIAAEMNKNQNR